MGSTALSGCLLQLRGLVGARKGKSWQFGNRGRLRGYSLRDAYNSNNYSNVDIGLSYLRPRRLPQLNGRSQLHFATYCKLLALRFYPPAAASEANERSGPPYLLFVAYNHLDTTGLETPRYFACMQQPIWLTIGLPIATYVHSFV